MSENLNIAARDQIKPEEFEIIPVKGTQNGMKIRDGICLPNGCVNLESVKKFKLSADDVIVSSYPKSGTTWTQEIVWLIENNLDFEKAKSSALFERYLWFDPGFTPKQLEESKPPRLIKNHLSVKFLPENLIESNAKHIYIARDPKDTLVSNYHFYKKVKMDRFIGTFEEATENFLEGKFWYGPWWQHVIEFGKLPNILMIYYEDLMEDPESSIKKIAEYLGKELNDNQIKQIIEFTSFENFKEKEEKKLLETAKDYFDSDLAFFRKGETGDWKNHFSAEDAKRFDEEIEKKLRDYKRSKNLCL